MAEATTNQTFGARTVIGMVGAGIIAFAAFLVLAAYAGDFRSQSSGRANALSIGATGFAGLIQMARAMGETPVIARTAGDLETEDLLVVTVEPETDVAALTALIAARQAKATLLILPKWMTLPDENRPGWVRQAGTALPEFAVAALKDRGSIRFDQAETTGTASARTDDALGGFAFAAPASATIMTGPGLTPLARIDRGGTLLAQLGDGPLYVLADPDLMNNHGLRDRRTAHAALETLHELNTTGAETIVFDVTLNGFGTRPNGLKLIFEPPFLALTVALFVAALLAGYHGAVRFGPERPPARLIAFGKAALVENSAALIRMARREHRVGEAYADVLREGAARDSGAAALPAGTDLDGYLDRISKSDRPGFTALVAKLRGARDRSQLLEAARALYFWKKDIVR